MLDRDAIRALKFANRPRRKKPHAGTWLLLDLAVLTALLIALFIAGKELGTPLLQSLGGVPVAQVQAVVGEPSLEEEEKLFLEAITYLRFCQQLEVAAHRLSHGEKRSEQAVRVIKNARPHCNAVKDGFDGWGMPGAYASVKKAVDGIVEALANFCEEIGRACERGVPPDQAQLKKTVACHQAPWETSPGGFSLSANNAI